MRDAGCRPMGRLFYWALTAMVTAAGCGLTAIGAAPQSGPATTTVSDTVYLADGSAASGTIIITWPAFVTASGTAVAPGSTSVALGANGALRVNLVPNVGATPAGVYYSVVYQLGAGQVKTETWMVPTTSPANLAAVRATPGTGLAAQPVSMQYVNSELATKANDNSVVHLSGAEIISGAKSFATSPSVPAPTNSGDIANKSYVDQSVSNVGAGSYLSTAGGTMVGPIVLPGNPSAPLQAAPKQYVDSGLYSKADLVTGIVPASELGTGTATAGSCLLGNGTWGACGGGGGSGNVSTTPAASQNVIQPAGTQFSTNNLSNVRYVTTSWNWLQLPTDNLATAGNNTIHLSPCPLGLDTSNNISAQYSVYIAGTGTAESVPVTGGTCVPGAGSGTITVTTSYTHGAGYSAGSATSGIQEAINDAGGTRPVIVLVPASGGSAPNYAVHAPVFLKGNRGILRGDGAFVQCFVRSACFIVGNYAGSGGNQQVVENLELGAGLNVDGVQISGVCAGASCSTPVGNGTYTVTTALSHPFTVGDYVIFFYSTPQLTQEARVQVLSTPAANQFTFQIGSATNFAQSSGYGWASIENAPIEVIAQDVKLHNIRLTPVTGYHWNFGVINSIDQQFELDGYTNEGSGGIFQCTANFCGPMFYARGDQGAAPISIIRHADVSLQCSGNGIRNAAGNTLHVWDSVIQGFNQYGLYYAGGLQGVTIGGVYQESSAGCINPAYPDSLYSQAGIITNSDLTYISDDPIGGAFPSFVAQNTTAAQQNNYYVVAKSSVMGVLGMYYIGSCITNPTQGNCRTYWPEPNLDSLGTVTYDELRTVGSTALPPSGTGNYLIASGISGNCNYSGLCSNTDLLAAASSYSIPVASYAPRLNFWPGSLVLGSATRVHMNNVAMGGGGIITGSYLPSVFAQHGLAGGNTVSHSPFWAVYGEGDSVGNNNPSVGAVIKQAGPATGTASSGLTGLYGFLNTAALGQTDMLTFAYSNPFLALATPGYRPAASATDTAVGFDSPSASGANAAQLALRAPVAISDYIGNIFDNSSYKERLTATAKTFNVPVTINGNLTVTGTCTGCGAGGGGGSGSGTVNSGNTSQIALYGSTGTAVSGDSSLTDNGTALAYSGAGGVSASSGTFSGNVTVGGQLILTGPWLIDTPIPGTAMGTATSGTSSLGISNDGNFYVSANAGAPSQVQTSATLATTLAGYVPSATTVNGHPLSANVTLSAGDIGTGTLPHAQLPALVSTDIPNNAANTSGSAGSLSTASALPNGTTATTQSPGDSSTKVATTAFVMQNQGGTATQWVPFPGYNGVNQTPFPTATNTAAVYGFTLPMTVTTSKVVYRVGTTADNSTNTYEIGIYNGSGTLVAHVQAAGTTFCPAATTMKTQNWTEGTVTLPPGKYYEAIVTSCSSACATFTSSQGSTTTFYSNSIFTQNVSGSTLGATVTAPGSGLESFGANPLSIILE